ncbi:energy transducer TonB [Gloeobacter violaceus]|uniref:energy transducer TonB n=1 Tax=Gloeobacter violaceus TaxID=33072 RepID=UPI0013E8C538|nr:energy transducer TonB [Gloeobacter violaceus]
MQPGSLWQRTPNDDDGGLKLILACVVGSALLHAGLFALKLPEPKPPEIPKAQKMVMVETAPKLPPPKPKVEPPKPKPPEPKSFSRKPVPKKSAPQKAKASRTILSSKAVSADAGTVSENQLAGSRGTGYGTEKGDDFGSIAPLGVDGGSGGTDVVETPPPPPPPPPPLVNARPKGAVQPEYPEIAQQNNWEGRVIVKAYINADGSVGEVQVAKSSGHSELDNAALAAVRNTKFEPARRGEESVGAWVRIPVTFSLQ